MTHYSRPGRRPARARVSIAEMAGYSGRIQRESFDFRGIAIPAKAIALAGCVLPATMGSKPGSEFYGKKNMQLNQFVTTKNMVELMRFELTTSAVRLQRSPS